MMSTHDPIEFSSGLAARLAANTRHVCTFLGAGAGAACRLPDIAALQEKVLESLEGEFRVHFSSLLKGGRTFEEGLSRLRRIGALLEDDQTIDGLTGSSATKLDRAVCHSVVAALTADTVDLRPMELFSSWLRRARYRLPVEIFTVNYDLLIETALESRSVPYFDGFIGNLAGRFQTQLVESRPDEEDWVPSLFVRLWKLHGSLNWAWTENGLDVVRMGYPAREGQAAAIYPSDMKYDESRRVPFVVLADRFRRSLNHPETLCLVTGYSFGDSHLNETLFEAAAYRERSEIIAFCYDEIPALAASKAMAIPNLQILGPAEAIIGGIRGDWAARDDSYQDIWFDGRFQLVDFRNLASFLARSSSGEALSSGIDPAEVD